MGMKEEFHEAEAWVEKSLTFNKDYEVTVFETTIRMVGGLLAAFSLSGNKMFLTKAEDIGTRLMPAFDTPSQMAAASVNLQTGKRAYLSWMAGRVVLSEVGSVQLEMRHLSASTGNTVFKQKGDAAMDKILSQSPVRTGLYGDVMDGNSGSPTSQRAGVGAFSDSFYEYLLKLWLQSDRKETKYRDAWDAFVEGAHQNLFRKQGQRTFITSTSESHMMEHLACFLPGAMALGSATALEGTKGFENKERDLRTARELMDTCFELYRSQPTGLAADTVSLNGAGGFQNSDSTYKLRPETAESLYWLHAVTGDAMYRDNAWAIYNAIQDNCNAAKFGGAGFGAYPNVASKGSAPNDKMESFFLGETLKYLFMIFDDTYSSLDFFKDKIITTEAHVLLFKGGPEGKR